MVDFIISGIVDEVSSILDEQLMVLNKHKFSHIEIRNINGLNVTKLSDQNLRILSRKLEFDEVDVTGINSKIGQVSINDKFDIQLEQFKRVVEVANILSTVRVRISSWLIPENEDYSNYHNKVVDQLGVLSEYAKKQSVKCFVENEKLHYMDNSNRVVGINRELENIKFVFNPTNTNLSLETPYDFYVNTSSLIDYFYISDVIPKGYDVADIIKILSAHKQNNNQTVLTIHPSLFTANNGDFSYKEGGVNFDNTITKLKLILQEQGFSYI